MMNIILYVFFILPSFLFLHQAIALSETVNLPATGQTSCYDEWGNEIDCTGTGQDGDIQAGVAWPSPRFTDNGDGTITDNLTGLMWLKNGNFYGGRLEWEDAMRLVAWFNDYQYQYASEDYTSDYSDWRLPNVNELESLINPGAADNISWLNSQGFFNVEISPWHYWTSTMYANSWGYLAWTTKIVDGYTNFDSMSEDHYVWPVRAGQKNNSDPNYPANIWKTGQISAYMEGDDGDLQMGVSWPSPRFTDNEDGTVTDNLTGLMWLKTANCMRTLYPEIDNDWWTPGDGRVIWQYALDFVAGINDGTYADCAAGYTDWRLPNRKEFRSLIDYSQVSPALPYDNPFTNVLVAYWTSTNNMLDPESAWVFYIYDGSMQSYLKGGGWGDDRFGVWPVRNNCSYSISPTSQIFSSDSGNGSVNITASDVCNWTVISNDSWITITSDSRVKGNGTVNYSVSANTGISSRTGTITIAGNTFTINQEGSEPGHTNPTPSPETSVIPETTPKPESCVPVDLNVEPKSLKLKREESSEVIVSVTCTEDSSFINRVINAKVKNGKKRIFVSPSSIETDAEGKAQFTITATTKTGTAKVMFWDAENKDVKDTITVKVKKK